MKNLWTLGVKTLELSKQPVHGRYIVGQTAEDDLLFTLAHLGYHEAAECALELIFNREDYTLDHSDAVNAYCELPLLSPPCEFWVRFEGHNWNSDSHYRNTHLWPVILAGSVRDEHRKLLKKILATAAAGFRHAAIQAASSFADPDMQITLVKLAMESTEAALLSEGEILPLCLSFQRWLRRNQIDITGLEHLFRAYESGDSKFLRAERFLNYIVCKDWHLLPFPAEENFFASRSKCN